jgi:hypothetical protein
MGGLPKLLRKPPREVAFTQSGDASKICHSDVCADVGFNVRRHVPLLLGRQTAPDESYCALGGEALLLEDLRKVRRPP